ncbi:FkbM family methyltransferase [Candidatus Woesebacteria bacterium]|nr:FkbM family methyltransferase [Candidatus Woesebacteria bacterium]
MGRYILDLKNHLASILTFLITRNSLQKIWTLVYKLSLRGMGILNAGSDEVTGELWFIDKLAQQKLGTIFDVGANTVIFGAEKLIAKEIYAFEPHPQIFATYLKNVPKKNKFGTKISAHNLAVGSKNEKVKLWDFADDSELKETQPTSTLASLNKTVIENLHGQKAQGFSVDCVTLDSFTKDQKIKTIALLKIDVEGFELEVLRGASQLLEDKKIELIQFEFNQMHVFQRVFFKNIADVLVNYKLYRLSRNGLLPLTPYSPVTHEIFAFQNILGIRNDRVNYWEEILCN